MSSSPRRFALRLLGACTAILGSAVLLAPAVRAADTVPAAPTNATARLAGGGMTASSPAKASAVLNLPNPLSDATEIAVKRGRVAPCAPGCTGIMFAACRTLTDRTRTSYRA